MYSDSYYAGDAPPGPARRQPRFRSNLQQQEQQFLGEDRVLDDDESPSLLSTNFAVNGNAGGVNNSNEMELIDSVQTQLEMDGRQEHARLFSDQYRQLMKDPSFSNRRDLLETFQRAFRSEEEMHRQSSPQFDEELYEEIPTNSNAFNFPRLPSSTSATAVRPPLLTNRRGGGMTLPHRMPHSATIGNMHSMADGDYRRSASNLSAAAGFMPTTGMLPPRPKYPTVSATNRKNPYGQFTGPNGGPGAMPSSSSSSAASAGGNMRFGLREPSTGYPLALANNTMPRPPLLASLRPGMMPSMSYQHLPNPSSSSTLQKSSMAASNTALPRSSSHAQFGQILSPHIEEEDSDTVTDWELIKDLVKVCNGINGQYIMLGDDKCELYAHVRINPAHSQIGLRIAEVGWLTGQIRTFIDRRRDRGYVKEGLYAGIQERLASLENDIVALDSQVRSVSKHNSEINRGNLFYRILLHAFKQLHVEDQEGFPAWERLTLSRLYALMIEPIKRLNVMFTVARHVDAMKGGEIVNYLYTQADEGDRDKRSTAIGLLSACVKPVFFMISHWLYHGQVRDECAEFFIRSIAPERHQSPPSAETSLLDTSNSFNTSSNDTLPNSFITPPDADPKQRVQQQQQPAMATWYEQFILIDEQIPKFIPPAMAYKIFIAGQTTCFLRTFCGDRAIPDFDKEIMPILLEVSSSSTTENHSADQQSEQAKQQNMSASTVTYSHLTQLWNPNTLRLDVRANTIFTRMHSIASRALMDTLNTEFHLSWHIEAIVNYMLHKRGDFVVELIELLRNDLERDAGSFTASSDIHGAVRLAVEQSSARTDPEEVLVNLSGDFDKKVSNSDVGWDLFSIRYRLDDVGPLQIIFTPDVMLRLRKMWRFIWRVKRADYLLTKLWWNAQTVFGKQQQELKSRFASASSDGSVVNEAAHDTACHVMLERLIVTEMLHFVQQLEHYICFEVVAVSHARLLEALGRATELKDLMLAVETFVTQLEERLFLKSFDETISVRVRSILTCVNAVQRCHESLVSLVTPHTGLMDHSINFGQQHHQFRQQQHAVAGNDAADSVRIVYDQLRQTYLKFQTLLCEFLHGLVTSSDDYTQALHFRLDYSHYYERLQSSYGSDLQSYLDIPLAQLNAAATVQQSPQQ